MHHRNVVHEAEVTGKRGRGRRVAEHARQRRRDRVGECARRVGAHAGEHDADAGRRLQGEADHPGIVLDDPVPAVESFGATLAQDRQREVVVRRPRDQEVVRPYERIGRIVQRVDAEHHRTMVASQAGAGP